MQVPQARQRALQRMRLRSPMMSVPQTKEGQKEDCTKRVTYTLVHFEQ